MQVNVLVFPLDRPQGRVLLGVKKHGFGAGKVVGIGGKLEAGETLAQAAVRELTEESGLTAKADNLWYCAYLEFVFPAKPEWDRVVHCFRLEFWAGEPSESDEITPQWFPLDALPYARMWDDGRYWVANALGRGKVRLRVTYGPDNATVQSAEELE